MEIDRVRSASLNPVATILLKAACAPAPIPYYHVVQEGLPVKAMRFILSAHGISRGLLRGLSGYIVHAK